MSGNIVGGNMRETLATFNPMYVGIAGIVLVLILLTFLLPSDRRKIEPAGDVDDRAFLPLKGTSPAGDRNSFAPLFGREHLSGNLKPSGRQHCVRGVDDQSG